MTVIYQDTDRIDSEEVQDRIAELETELIVYAAVRVRTGEVLYSSGDKDETSDWIREQDYDPAKVTVVTREEITPELRELRALDRAGANGISDWGGVTVLAGSAIDGEYAKQDWLDSSDCASSSRDCRDALRRPPLSLIDWNAYARILKDGAEEFSWDGRTWYYI